MGEVPCCSGLAKVLRDWDGDGRYYYRCMGGPTPSPSPTPAPSPSSGCNVGDHVACPAGGFCAGDQCCHDGSTCPSAHSTFSGCPSGKTVDCTSSSSEIA